MQCRQYMRMTSPTRGEAVAQSFCFSWASIDLEPSRHLIVKVSLPVFVARHVKPRSVPPGALFANVPSTSWALLHDAPLTLMCEKVSMTPS